jgi:alpha-ribazole phosphatase/probable phosphoglycerate mutase
MQEIFLIRHAATDMSGTLCGQSDPPLNAAGKEQAIALAQSLRSWNLRRLYASDLRRGVQTAEALAELWGVPIVAQSDLREISFGDWEGRRWSEVRASRPDSAALESLIGPCAPGGETFACFRGRVLRALKKITGDCGGQRIAIVTHLGAIRVVLKELNSSNRLWDLEQRINHCSVHRIPITGAVLEHIRALSSS